MFYRVYFELIQTQNQSPKTGSFTQIEGDNSMNKLKKINRLLVAVIAVFLLSPLISAQQKIIYGRLSIKTDYGYLFISNTTEKSYSFEIRGKDVEDIKGGSNPTFIVDEKLLQVIQVDTKAFVSGDEKLTEEAILEKYKVWESDYLSGQFGKKLDLKIEKVTVKDFKTMFWGYQRPAANTEYDRDYLLTKVVGNNVLALTVSLYVGDKVSDYQKFLVETLGTLKISDEPFDIKKLTEEILKTTEKRN